MSSFSTDDELESSSSVESESFSNEFSLEEELINSYLPLQSSASPTTTTTTTTEKPSNDDLVKSRLEKLYPLVQGLECSHHEKKKEKKKQELPTLISAITGEPYSPLAAQKSEPEEGLEKSLREIFIGPESGKAVSQFMESLPELLPISSLNLGCDPDWDAKHKQKKEKKEKKEKRFTMSDMMPHFADRLATEMLFQDGIQNSTIKSLISTGQMPLGCITEDGPCDGRSILAHIRQFHGEFYHLLYMQNLLDTVESRKDLAVIIPQPTLLVTLDVTSESTRKTLLYHLVIIPNHNFLQNVEGMFQYETLSGDYIQVESDNGKHYVNGVSVAKPDVNCIYHIYHVNQILSPLSIVSISEPPEEEPVSEGVTEGEGEEEPMRGTETMFISTKLNSVTSGLTKSQTSLGLLADKMNSQFYLSSHEMKDYLVESKTQESKIYLNIYNTTDIYSDYQSARMLDISRIRPETVLSLSFSDASNSLTHLDMGDLKMTEYACSGAGQARVKKSDLARGLVGLSFQLNESPGFVVLMCKMFPRDGNCFVSEDGNLLMRFSDDRLDSIALNQHALTTKENTVISTSPLGEHHFFEYKVTPELDKVGIQRAEFDSLLLTHGKIKRWFKKKTQQATDKAKCSYKRLQSIDLRPIPAGYLKNLVDQINLKTMGANSQASFVSLNTFDKSCNVLSSKSVLAKRFNVSTDKGDKVIVYEFNSSDPAQTSMEGDYHILEIQMDASPKLSLHTHTINRKGNDYFTAKRNANVYLFAFDPLNGGIRSLYITLAKSHLGKKILDYSRGL